MSTRRPKTSAFSMLEVLIVMAVIGVMAGILVASFSPNVASQLQSAAGILGGELAYARSLAVSNSDNYKITFDLTNNRWVLTHSGPNYALDALPTSPFHLPTDPPNQQTVDLAKLPSVGGPVRLHAIWRLSAATSTVSDVEFTSLGGTTRSEPTLVWLAAGTGASTRYISVLVNPVTGLFWIDNFQSTVPLPGNFSAIASEPVGS